MGLNEVVVAVKWPVLFCVVRMGVKTGVVCLWAFWVFSLWPGDEEREKPEVVVL